MKNISKLSLVLITLSSLFTVHASAATAYTDPVGGIQVTAKASSDTSLGFAVHQPSDYTGLVNGVAGSVITVQGVPGWTASSTWLNGGSTGWYAMITGGVDDGMILPITDNGTDSITVAPDAGDTLVNVVNGVSLKIIPFWTPTTYFGVTAPAANTEILLFSNSSPGVNPSSDVILKYFAPNWRDTTNGFAIADDYLLYPSESFVVRDASGSDQVFAVAGNVLVDQMRTQIFTLDAVNDQDVRFSITGAVGETLSGLNIPVAANDEIFVFDNAAAGLNKSASTIYKYFPPNWRDTTNGFAIADSDLLDPGNGFVYRKKNTGSAEILVWQDEPDYVSGL